MSSNEFVAAKGVIVVENDPGNAQAFSQVEGDAKRMAKTVTDGSKAAGDAVGKIGEGAGKSGAELDRATKSMIASVQRATAAFQAGGSSGAKYFEAISAQRNLNVDALKPYIEQLRQAEAAHKAATGSIGESGHAMEEFSFHTAGAKRELLVLTHELSQGNFSRFGSSLLVLAQRTGAAALLFSGAALAVAGVAAAIGGSLFAIAKGAAELHDFQDAATLTGNALGITNTRFAELRTQIGGIATQGKAAEVLNEIAATGQLAGTNIRAIGEAAILMEKATGTATAETIKQFVELSHAPAEASARLNESTNFLTASLYRQIKALEDQGKRVEAANLAEAAYAESLKTRAQSVVDNAGLMEKAWKGITGAAKGAWDAMLGVGRQVTNTEQVDILRRNLTDRQARNKTLGIGDSNGDTAVTADIKQQIGLLQENERIEKRLATIQEEKARKTRGEIDFQKIEDQNLTKQQQLEREIAKIRQAGLEAGRAEVDIQRQIANARQRFAETGGLDALAGIRAAAVTAQQTIDLLRKKMDEGDTGGLTALTASEAKVNEIQQKLAVSTNAVTRAHLLQALAVGQNTVAVEKQEAATKKQYDLWVKSLAVIDGFTEANVKQFDAIKEQAEAQEAANSTLGKGKTAIEQMVLAQMRARLQEADAFDNSDPKYIASLELKIKAQQRYVAALQESEFIQEKQRLNEAAIGANETTATLQLEVSLLGATQQEREKIIALRRIEIELAKEERRINELTNLGEGPDADRKRQELLASARATALVASQNAAAKIVIDEWQRAADSINSSLTNAISDWVTSGKSLAKGLARAFEQEFSNLVLRPIIQGALSPISGALGSAATSAAGSSLFGSSAGSALGSVAGVGKFTTGLGSEALNGTLFGNVAAGYAGTGSSFASTVGAGLATDATGATVAEGAAAATLGSGSAVGATLAAIPVVGWIALAALAAYAIFGKKGGGPKEGAYLGAASANPTGFGVGATEQTSAAVSAVQQTVTGLQSSYDGFIKSIGGKGGATFGFGVQSDPKGTAAGVIEATVRDAAGKAIYSAINHDASRDDATLQAQLKTEGERAVLAALESSDLPQNIQDYLSKLNPLTASSADIEKALSITQDVGAFDFALSSLGGTLGDLASLSVDATTALIQAAGGLDTLKNNLSSYYANFYSDAEKSAFSAAGISKTLTGAGISLSAADVTSMTREQFRALVDKEIKDVQAGLPEATPLLAALLSVNQAFSDLHPVLQQAAADARATLATLLQGQTDTALQALQRVVNQQLTGAQAAEQAAQGNVDTLTNIFGIIDSGVKTLYGQVSSTSALQVQQSRDFIAQALGTAQKTGYLSDGNALQNAIQTATGGIDPNKFATQFDLDRERLTLAGQLSGLQGITGKELTNAEKQLDAAKTQVAYLQDILTSAQAQTDALRNGFTTLAAALQAFSTSFAVEQRNGTPGGQVASLYQQLLGRAPDAAGFQFYTGQQAAGVSFDQIVAEFQNSPEYMRLHPHAGGLERVPYDGYPALLHKDEAVLNAGQANTWRGADPVGDLAARIESLEQTTQAIGRAQVSSTKEMQKTLDGWNRVGLLTRTA